MSEADPTRRDDPPAGDPDAPLPPDAPPFVKAFYDFVTSLEGADPAEKVDAVIQWVRDNYPRIPHPAPHA